MRALVAAVLLAGVVASPVQAGAKSDEEIATSLRKCAPETYEAALDCLDRFLPDEQQAALAAPDGAIDAHFGLGMFIRNNWGLWKQGPLYAAMKAKGFSHPDDMSGAILDGFAARERGEAYRPVPPDPAVAQAMWDQAVKEGRAASFQCERRPEPAQKLSKKKRAEAAAEEAMACLDQMAESLKGEQE